MNVAPNEVGVLAEDVVLRVRDLHATFTTKAEVVHAVRGVDLDVVKGERLALVGESGCGKSALALSIAGLLEPPGRVDEGEIRLAGRDLTTLRERDLQRIRGKDVGVVFQDALTGLDPVKTVGSQIAESIRAHDRNAGRGAARRRSVELLSEVGINSPQRRADDYPHQFSGGMRQRVMIAMAIANEPQLLIADEPTTALDVTTQAQILRLLARMAEHHGCAVIFITHDLGIVAGFCDSVCVMYAGRIVERSPVEEIFKRPAHPYTEALLRAIPRPGVNQRGRLVEIGGAPPDLANLPRGCSFEPRCFFGHGNERCLNDAPSPTRIDGPVGVVAECHFVRERLASAAESGRME
jgi:oligopeptide/dipeptide ABC transporter ATP-binding protein